MRDIHLRADEITAARYADGYGHPVNKVEVVRVFLPGSDTPIECLRVESPASIAYRATDQLTAVFTRRDDAEPIRRIAAASHTN